MSWFGKLLGTEQAIEHIGNVADKGMTIWDMSSFTPQERVAAFERLAKVTSSTETAISRRVLLWALVIAIDSCLALGAVWVAMGDLDKVSQLIDLVHALKLDWAFTGAVSFYYLTHIINGKKK